MDITILHLSDLHISEKNGAYSEVLENLLIDIEEQCSQLNHIVLVITGDIIDKAMYTNSNVKITLEFFEKLRKEIGTKIIGVEIVPGNHDKEHQEINKNLIDAKRNTNEIININESEWEYFLIPYKRYLSLINEIRKIFKKDSNTIVNSYYVELITQNDFSLIFINMDTSWSSYGGSVDKRQLCIDERQLNELKEDYQKIKRELSGKYFTIMNAHHPLNWLREKDETFISSWLLNSEYFNIDFYLSGHTHDRQIKSFLDTYKSYITLVTGIGWDEKTPEEEKNKHRYSIYNLNIKNNSCEIIVRKTRSDGKFDYDNDILLTEEEKLDKRIYLSLNPFKITPKISIPIYRDNMIKNEYLFVDNNILEKIKKISIIFYEITNHMILFQAMHINDFFRKFELNKTSKGTVIKQEIYEDYFYKNIESPKVNVLFDKIVNNTIIYKNFISYLRELCGTIVKELKFVFDEIENFRFHFRKHFQNTNNEEVYIAFCQASNETNPLPPPIREITYNSMIKIAFEENVSIVYEHNKPHNPLSMDKSTYDNFITIAPHMSRNVYNLRERGKEKSRPYLSASLSITCKEKTNLLDILNYLGIDNFIFKFVYDYVALFKINMEKFIKSEEDFET